MDEGACSKKKKKTLLPPNKVEGRVNPSRLCYTNMGDLMPFPTSIIQNARFHKLRSDLRRSLPMRLSGHHESLAVLHGAHKNRVRETHG